MRKTHTDLEKAANKERHETFNHSFTTLGDFVCLIFKDGRLISLRKDFLKLFRK